MRESWEEMRARSKKWPYPNYTIIPAGGSLFSDTFASSGKTRAEMDALLRHILSEHGARKADANETN